MSVVCPTVRMSQNHVLSTNSIHRRSYCLSVGHKLLSVDAYNVTLILEFKLIQIGEILAPASVIVNVWPCWSCNKRLQSALLFIATLTPSNHHQGVICLSVLSGRVQWRISFTLFAFFLLPSCNGGLGIEIIVFRGKSSFFKSIINKMQRYTIFFITVNALHVSGGFSSHHQKLKTVYTAYGIHMSSLTYTRCCV